MRVELGRYGELEQAVLTDPQTSGGLLVACDASAVSDVLEIFRAEGFDQACIIGELRAGAPGVSVV